MSDHTANAISQTGRNNTGSDTTYYAGVRGAHRAQPEGLNRQQVSAVHIARFLSKFDKGSDCWLWTAGAFKNGYGMFSLGRDAQGRQHTQYAHRIAYVLAKGDIPARKVVMHSCDVPACVNPDHLKLGTQADNMADRKAKGHYFRPRVVGSVRWKREQRRKAA